MLGQHFLLPILNLLLIFNLPAILTQTQQSSSNVRVDKLTSILSPPPLDSRQVIVVYANICKWILCWRTLPWLILLVNHFIHWAQVENSIARKEEMFFFHNDAFLLFLISNCEGVCEDVGAYLVMYNFITMRDWWGVNVMNLCCGFKASAIVSHPSKSCQL